MRIFAIDDEKASLYFLSKAIQEVCPNDELKQFSNYIEFLNAFKEDLPDIAFLDVEMPEVDGIELGKMIKEIKKDINIIYVTAFKEYAIDAFKLNASSYIVKPINNESVLNAINNLRYDIEKEKDIVIKTFGNFDIAYQKKPVLFRSPKSKEALAYLVDRQGTLVTKKELGAVIYEDDYSLSTQAMLSRNIKYLEEDLEKAGIKGLVLVNSGAYSVDLSITTCDLIEYLEKGDSMYTGEYMEQYSWAEDRKMNLEKNQENF